MSGPNDTENTRRLTQFRYGLLIVCYLLIAAYTFYWIRQAFGYGYDYSIYYDALHRALIGQSAYFPYTANATYNYSPPVLLLISPLGWLSHDIGFAVWEILSAAAYLFSIFLAFRLTHARQTLPSRRIFVLVLLLFYMPFWENMQLGQINTFVLAALLVCFTLAENDRPLLAGVFLALAIIPKLTPALFIVYFLVVRQYRVALGALLTLTVLALLTYIQFGSLVFRDFIQLLPQLMAETTAGHYLNLGSAAIAVRLFTAVGIQGADSAVNLAYKLILAVLAGLLFLVALVHPTRQSGAKQWLFAALLIIVLLLSPWVWFHQETILLLALSILLFSERRDIFVAGVLIIFAMQSERLVYNLVAVSVGQRFPDSLPVALALITGTPTLIAEIALFKILVAGYVERWQISRTGLRITPSENQLRVQ